MSAIRSRSACGAASCARTRACHDFHSPPRVKRRAVTVPARICGWRSSGAIATPAPAFTQLHHHRLGDRHRAWSRGTAAEERPAEPHRVRSRGAEGEQRLVVQIGALEMASGEAVLGRDDRDHLVVEQRLDRARGAARRRARSRVELAAR